MEHEKHDTKNMTQHDFSVSKMKFAYGNDTKIKRRHLKANVKNNKEI